MDTARFIMRRLIHFAFVLWGLSVLIFIVSRVVPGDPARMALGPRAPQWAVDRLRAEMHLDQPVYVQYLRWLQGALRGELGRSLVTRRDVTHDIAEFLPATIELALFAGLLMAAGGIALGVLSARYANTWIDNGIRLVAYAGVVTPSYVFAILFLLLFGYLLDLFPTLGRLSEGISGVPRLTGLVTVDALARGRLDVFADAVWHLVLPGLALAMGGLAQEARITRASMADNARKDYVAAARAGGVPERVVMLKHLLKPSLIPTVSILGLDFAALFSNAFLVELIFNWPGLSRYGMNAMLRKDLNAVVGVIITLGAIFAIVNIAVDLVVAWLDPRIRLRSVRGEAP